MEDLLTNTDHGELGVTKGHAVPSTSEKRLNELGYKSEFRRDMSLFGVLGISFCAIGILTGMSSAFQTGLFSGGPLGLFWGWNVSYAWLSLAPGHHTARYPDMQHIHATHSPVVGRDMQHLVSKPAARVHATE